MKKTAFVLTLISIVATFMVTTSVAEPIKVYRWQQAWCPDGKNKFEACTTGGNGEICYNPGEQTRNCPPSTN